MGYRLTRTQERASRSGLAIGALSTEPLRGIGENGSKSVSWLRSVGVDPGQASSIGNAWGKSIVSSR